MTSIVSSHTNEHQATRGSWFAVLQLGLREGRRMLLSPVVLLIVSLLVLSAGVEVSSNLSTLSLPSRAKMYDIILSIFAFYAGMVFYISCHLVASSARRVGAERQLAAAPLSSRARSTGLCLGVILGPGLLAVAAMVALALLGNDLGFFYGAQRPFSVIEMTQVVATVVGAGMFAVMCATWLRFPGSLPLGFVILIFGTILISDAERAPINTWPWFAPYIAAPDWIDDVWALMGSQVWHAFYLAGLCALAYCAVMLRERDKRMRWLVISFGVLAATATVGALQL